MTTHPSLGQARRAARIRRVVEDVMSRRAAGETVADAEVAARHADLMPELSRELAALGVLERAWSIAQGRTQPGTPRPPRELHLLPPDSFDGYELSGQVHRGGQGVVYEAVQKSTGRRVAIKVMREGLFAGDADTARFEREVRILGQIDHPGVVSILASGVHTGHFFYVMELLTGLPLDRYADERCPGIPQRLEVFIKVCAAVSAAHLRGIIHRDLKPANIIVDGSGQPRILDFGLARITAEWAASRHATHTGQFIGSMPWASPEQAAGNPARIDLRTDVYSLGVILYGLLTGRFPYRVEGGPRDVLDQILTAEPARPRSFSRAIDEDLEAIVLKCLAKERERRYQSAAELTEDLRRYLDRRPVLARPPSTGYQVRTFVRRHRPLVFSAAAVLATLTLGLVGTSLGLIEASSGRRAAEEARDRSRTAEAVAVQQLAESQRQAYVASVMAADSALRAMDSGTAQIRLDAAPESLRDWEWRYLRRRMDLSVAVLDTPPVRHATTTPAGDAIIALCKDGSLRVIDAATGQARWRTQLPPGVAAAPIQSVAGCSPDGSMVVTGHDHAVYVWRIGSEAPPAVFYFPLSNWGWINAAITPDRRRLIANGREGMMFIGDIESGETVRLFDRDVAYWGVDLLPGGRTAIVGTNTGVAEIDTQTGATLRRIPVENPVTAGTPGMLRVSPSGTLAAVVTRRGVAIIDLARSEARSLLSGHEQQVNAVAFSSDSRRLATTGWDRTVRVWDLASGAQERSLWGHAEEVTGLGFVLSDTRIVSAGNEGPIRLWDPSASASAEVLGTGRIAFNLTIAPRTGLLAAMIPGAVQIWDPARAQDPPRLPPVQPATECMGGVNRDFTLISSSRLDGAVVLADLATGALRWSATPPVPPGADPTPAYHAFSPDSRLLATTTRGGALHIWDVATGALLRTIAADFGNASPITFDPRGELVLVPSGPAVNLWEAATGRLRASIGESQEPSDQYLCATVSGDGRLIATGDSRGTAAIWDAATLAPLRRLRGMKPVVWSVAFNPSGTRLAVGSQDRTTRVWDPATGEQLLVLRGHTGSVVSLAWSPDGSTLASGAYDGTVRLWHAAPAAPR